MPKGTRERPAKSSRKDEDVISRKATKHHEFIGDADRQRARAARMKFERARKDHEETENEIVKEMAREMEEEAGLREPRAVPRDRPREEAKAAAGSRGFQQQPRGAGASEQRRPQAEQRTGPRSEDERRGAEVLAFPRPRNLREGLRLIEELPETLRRLRAEAPAMLEMLRRKAEARLASLPEPLRSALALSEKAVDVVRSGAKVGIGLLDGVIKTPAALVRILFPQRDAA